MAKAKQSQDEEEVSEDALLNEAEETEASEDDLLQEAQSAGTPDAAQAPSQATSGPTFYIPDAGGGFQPISYDNALRANAQGIKVLSEAEVRALRDAPTPTAPSTPKPPSDPGLARTMGRGLLQGFFKQGADEAAGAVASAGPDLGPGARLRMPDGTTRPVERSGDVYRAVRDTEREIERGAREHRPVTSFLSNMAGDIASDAALSALGVPVASTPYQVASGALSGLLGNDAELSTDKVEGRNAASAAGSTALGAGLGYVLPKVGTQVARALPGTMASLRQAFENRALDKVKKVLTAGSGQLARRKPVSNEAAREALDAGAIPIWGTTQGAFERLKDIAETRGKTYADILTELEAAGVQGPEVEALAQRLALEGADRRANTGANKSIASVFENEAANIRNVAPSTSSAPAASPTMPVTAGAEATKAGRPRGMPTTPAPATTASRLPLSQAERIKRALQEEARFDKIQATGLDEAKQEVSSMYRKAIEDAIEEAGQAAPPGSEVASLAERFVPTKRQLARTIEARDAAERGAGAAAHRVGGAAGVNLFDVGNAANATGTKGIPALLLAGAGRIWKERGPSTLANVYDLSAEAAQNLGRYASANPETTQALARIFSGPIGRQAAASSTVEETLADYLRRRQRPEAGR